MRRLLLVILEGFLKVLVLACPPAAADRAVTGVRTGGAKREGPVKPGSRVVALDDPLNLGVGRVLTVEKDGRLRVEFQQQDGGTTFELFDAFELELLEVWLKAESDTLTIRDLRRLRQGDTRKS